MSVPPWRDMKRLTAIDAARGIASVLVMLYHCNSVVQSPKYFGDQPFGGFFGLAGVRMPFFFAMSGFMLSMVHARDIGQPERLERYLLSRFARIYPVYWLVLLVVIPVYLARPDFGGSAGTATLGTLVGSFLLWPQPGVPYLAVAWTLQSMVLFYAVFALAIWRRWVGAVVFVVWQSAVLFAVIVHAQLDFPWSFLLQPLYFNFLLGGIAAQVAMRGNVRRPRVWFAAGLLYLVSAALTDFTGHTYMSFDWQLVANGVASAVMLVGLAAWERTTALRVPRVLLACGEASYGIFLIHYPLLSVLAKAGMAVGLGTWLSGEAIFVLFAGISVVAGIVFQRTVETPLTFWVQRRLGVARGKGIVKPGRDPAQTKESGG